MKTELTIIVWRVDGKHQLRAFPIGEVDLKNFDGKYTCDGAIHDDYRLNGEENATLWLAAIIKQLLSIGYTIEHIEFQLIGIEGYANAIQQLVNQLKEESN